MFIIKARDCYGIWQHFNVGDEVFFSDTLEEIFDLGFTDVEVYARINWRCGYIAEYAPADIWH